ncbi:MAG: hypothetical protein LKG21_06020 [Ruminococcus sp.]|jgi:hypothetical protein|nr:hypothetical protein [Ruminococcus sp.]
MSYYGENNLFSFRDNFCEQKENTMISSSELANFGCTTNFNAKRIAIGFGSENLRGLAYALAGGISDNGTEVVMTDICAMPSFSFCVCAYLCNIGIYLSGCNVTVLHFFDEYGMPLNKSSMLGIMNSKSSPVLKNSAKISSFINNDVLYLNKIFDSFGHSFLPLDVSCGNKDVLKLWHEVFASSNNTANDIVLSVSDNGMRVSAYSRDFGFISHQRLILALAVRLMKNNIVVALPETFHFGANFIGEKYNGKLIRFGENSNKLSKLASEQRFTFDCLALCASIFNENFSASEIFGDIPELFTAVREFSPQNPAIIAETSFIDRNNLISVSRSGKNRFALSVQSRQAETAAELCGIWQNKLSQLSVFTKNFPPEK